MIFAKDWQKLRRNKYCNKVSTRWRAHIQGYLGLSIPSKKKKKILAGCGGTRIVSAEARGLLESRRSRLPWTMISLCIKTWATEQDHVTKKKLLWKFSVLRDVNWVTHFFLLRNRLNLMHYKQMLPYKTWCFAIFLTLMGNSLLLPIFPFYHYLPELIKLLSLFKVFKKLSRPGTVAKAYNPSTLGGWGGWITRSRDQDQPGQHGETPSLLKIQKLAGHGGAHL